MRLATAFMTLLFLLLLDGDEPDCQLHLSSCRNPLLNLHQNVLRETSDLDTAPGRLRLAKVLGVDPVERGKVVHVLEEHGALEDGALGRSRGSQ